MQEILILFICIDFVLFCLLMQYVNASMIPNLFEWSDQKNYSEENNIFHNFFL